MDSGRTDLGVALTAKATLTADDVQVKDRRYPLWWWIGLVILAAILVWSFFTGFMPMLRNPEAIHSPGMADFFPEPIAWDGSLLEINRLVIARIVAAAVVCLIVAIVALNMRRVPGRGQAIVEMTAEFVRKNIGIELLGNKKGRQYAVVLSVIFFGVLAMNLTGIVPGINIAASSVMSVPLVFAVFAYVTFIVAGVREHGGWKFLKGQLFPPGVPWPVYILLTPIELFSTFIVRPCTLAIRLLANMIAGHMLLAICYFGTQVMMAAIAAQKVIAVATFAGAVAVTLFEIFVAFLQAYVFTMLTAVYIKLSVESH